MERKIYCVTGRIDPLLFANLFSEFYPDWFYLVLTFYGFQGSTYNGQWDGWYGPSGREWVYDVGGVIGSTAGRAVASIGLSLSADSIRALREDAMIKCPPRNDSLPLCRPLQAPCLFNVREDPCEDNNLINK